MRSTADAGKRGGKIVLAYRGILRYTNAMQAKKTRRPEFLTLPEVAGYLRLSIHTIYKMAERGRIPALKAGAVWRFDRAEIDEWMRAAAGRKRGARRNGVRRGR